MVDIMAVGRNQPVYRRLAIVQMVVNLSSSVAAPSRPVSAKRPATAGAWPKNWPASYASAEGDVAAMPRSPGGRFLVNQPGYKPISHGFDFDLISVYIGQRAYSNTARYCTVMQYLT